MCRVMEEKKKEKDKKEGVLKKAPRPPFSQWPEKMCFQGLGSIGMALYVLRELRNQQKLVVCFFSYGILTQSLCSVRYLFFQQLRLSIQSTMSASVSILHLETWLFVWS